MDSPQYAGDRAVIEVVSSSGRIGAEDGQRWFNQPTVSHDDSFWGFTRFSLH